MALKLLLGKNHDEHCPKEKGQAKSRTKVHQTRSSNGLPIYIEIKPVLSTTLYICCPNIWLRNLIVSKQVVSFLTGDVVKSLGVEQLFRGRGGERGVEGGNGGEGRGVSDGCLLPFFKRLKRGKGALPSWKSGRQLEKNPVISVPKTHSSAISGSGGNLREPFCFSVLCVQ